MEDSGLNLMAGIVVGAILIMGVVYATIADTINRNTSNIMNSYETMDRLEKEEFNGKFIRYEGTKKTGLEIHSLISNLIENANRYQDEPNRIPSFIIVDKINESADETKDATPDNVNEYIENLNLIENLVELKHEYTVRMHYNVDGIIDEISIYYEEQ